MVKSQKKLKIAITIISFIGCIITKSDIKFSALSSIHISPLLLKEMIYDLCVGVFSAMLLVWFIDEINAHLQEQKSQKKELEEIQRFDNIIQLYINQYVTFFYSVVTPLEKRDFKKCEMPEHFKLSDMRDLYLTSTLVTDGLMGASIKSFLQIELEIRNEFSSLVKTHDFTFYPQIQKIFIDFIQLSLSYDCRSFILAVPTMSLGEGQKRQDMKDFIRNILDENADAQFEKFKSGEDIGGNILISYMFLHLMMERERILILKYQEEIRKIQSTH